MFCYDALVKLTKNNESKCINFFTGDFAWITFTLVLYGSLSAGITDILFDSSHMYPNPGRLWEMCQRLRITTVGVFPNIVRDLMCHDNTWVTNYDLTSLTTISIGIFNKRKCSAKNMLINFTSYPFTGGEPSNKKIMKWLNEIVGHKRASIIEGCAPTELSMILHNVVKFDTLSGEQTNGLTPFFGVGIALLDNDVTF